MDRANYPGTVYMDLLEQVSDGVSFVNSARRITYWNTGAARLTGFTAEEVLGRRCSAGVLRHVDERGKEFCQSDCVLAAVMDDGLPSMADTYLLHKDGHRVAVTIRGHALTDPDGRIVGVAEVFSLRTSSPYADLERRGLNSSDDPVTGMPARRLGDFHLASLLAAVAAGEAALGVLFVDVDEFKGVNDTHGHQAGDRVLRMVGRSMATALRRGDLPIRWGGEEFVALMPGADAAGLTAAAERVRVLVENSWLEHAGTRLQVTVSVGATLARPDDSPEELVDRADRLMYQSKRAGRNRVTTDAGPGPTGSSGWAGGPAGGR
ncbi:MAG TPA: diguanylate cyclase [Dermatophilaceae bacterium]|nr:diguanylate cyclase [Dermatophilaceae bacterium]